MLSHSTTLRHIVEVEEQIHSYVTSTQVRREWSTPRPGRFTLGKNPNTHFTECSVASEAVQTFCRRENVLTPPGFELRIVQHVA